MTHPILGPGPYPWHQDPATKLYRALLEQFSQPNVIDGMYKESGENLPPLNLSTSPDQVWREALDGLAPLGLLSQLIDVVIPCRHVGPKLADAIYAVRAAPYPVPLWRLADLLAAQYSEFDQIVELVRRAGGDVSRIESAGTPMEYRRSALAHLYEDKYAFLRLGAVVNGDNFWQPEMGQLLGEALDAGTGDGALPWPSKQLPLKRMAETLATHALDRGQIRNLGRSAKLPDASVESQVAWFDPDPRTMWRTLLVTAALDNRMPAVLAELQTEYPLDPAVERLAVGATTAVRQASTPKVGSGWMSTVASNEPWQPGPQEHARTLAAIQLEGNTFARDIAPGRSDAALRQLYRAKQFAFETLERLHSDMDQALERFGRADAGLVEAAPKSLLVQEYTDIVADLALEVETAAGQGWPQDELLKSLARVIGYVLEGLAAAERYEKYERVAELAGAAAGAYQTVAKQIPGEQGQILMRVVPYWRMKAIYAGHKAQLGELSTSAAGSSSEPSKPRPNK
jgi:hypothetical protein